MSETAQEERILYFGYGSNMLTERLCKRCSSAEKIQPSMGSQHLLKGWKFTFSKLSTWNVDDEGNGKGNIERTENSQDKVYGVIFEILDSEKQELDWAEYGYDQREMTILDEKNSRKNCENVIVYYKEEPDNSKIPYDWYKAYIVEGAKKHNLPKSYIKDLEKRRKKRDPDPLNENHDVTREWLRKCGYDV